MSNIDEIIARAEARDMETMRNQIAERNARADEAADLGIMGDTPTERRVFRAWQRSGFRNHGGFRL